ncbi:peptidase T [Brucepastera parasyntrophica]|uniref:peptidase T n=1 Tax=Brucepastera parasyntrophica TaxID=2880008 RepID=UPI00210A3186|nr:peptidase T [Brucepastera parasyntrophica]ULQ59015.1 peptidase T [Brucepastera parasyntrophica]
MEIQKDLLEPLLRRFTKYVSIDSQSNSQNADNGIMPSTENQWVFARTLLEEFKSLGIIDAELDGNCYLLARLPATPGKEESLTFGLCSHIDTSGEAPGSAVKPQFHKNYDGRPIILRDGFSIDPKSDSDLASCAGRGDTIITSDGTTLLGADDKAGIAGIMTMLEYLISHPEIPHGPVEILFSPDEETGHGMDKVPLDRIRSKAFYTVDGGQEGELEIECFNAWKCDLMFTGIAAHLGTARGKMVNALTMAASFISALPQQESPETTDGYEGYFCPLEAEGTIEKARVSVLLRDFDRANMEARLDRIDVIARGIEARFPGGKIKVARSQQYLNMKEKLEAAPHLLSRLQEAAGRAGVETYLKPIRGGTDGSRLTEMGIPTPNIFTGGHNFHSRTEWASLLQMGSMVGVLIELVKVWGEQ